MKSMEFAKMDGAGNDFVVVADVPENDVQHSPEAIRALCDRRRGIGADGVLILKPLSPGELKMAYYNSDGSAETVCAARWNLRRNRGLRTIMRCSIPERDVWKPGGSLRDW